jgi:phosphopantothenoylcysteine decarboxylase/phosphopantothenate--cysteine ligase
MILRGRKVLLGVTGGIAAYKSVLLLRLLQESGAEVRVALTTCGEKMVGRATFEALSGHPVLQEVFTGDASVAHIEAAQWADLIVVAPCTANTLARLANGMSDDMLALIYLAAKCPKLVVPSMNPGMYSNPATVRNAVQLRADGAIVMEPARGVAACGDEGVGRMPEPQDLLEACERLLLPLATRGKVVIAAGRTEEPLDPVRFLTNRSSGRTAMALARAYRTAGWQVVVVAGPMETRLPSWVERIRVRTAREMRESVGSLFPSCDILVMTAAVADFTPAHPSEQKIKGSRKMLTLELEANPDILREMSANAAAGQVVVGFALETEQALEHGRHKLEQKGCHLLVVNTPVRADSGFGKPNVECALLGREGVIAPFALRDKMDLAKLVVESSARLAAGHRAH